MYVKFECDAAIFLEARKEVAKIIKWCNNNTLKYYDIINQVDGCILVTRNSRQTWCTFQSINTIGEVDQLEFRITNSELMTKLSKLASKIKGFNHTIETFDGNPIGCEPYFLFTKTRFTYCVAINRNKTVDIHVVEVD
jgi:hypothetical protein